MTSETLANPEIEIAIGGSNQKITFQEFSNLAPSHYKPGEVEFLFSQAVKGNEDALERLRQWILNITPKDILNELENYEGGLEGLASLAKQAGDKIEGKTALTGEYIASEIKRLSELPAVDYDRQRAAVAKTLGLRASTLDAEVEKLKPKEIRAGGDALKFNEPLPWDEPVDGAFLLDELEGILSRYIIIPLAAIVALVLWILHTYCMDAAVVSPICALTSPEKRCGKTSLLSIIAALVYRALSASNISPAAVYRVIQKFKPCLLIDEADSFLEGNEELRGVLNSGHSRGAAFVVRCNPESMEPETFSTWGAKCIALIGTLPDTLHDRSIVIPLRRKLPGEKVESLRIDKIDFHDTRRRLLRWSQDNLEALKEAEPKIPGGLNDRAADNWRPLLSIADIAGGAWAERAREACLELCQSGDDSESLRVLLLGDLRGLMNGAPEDEIIPTETLLDGLLALTERPWGEFSQRGKPINAQSLSAQLKPFGIKSERHRASAKRGYRKGALLDAFKRYLPGEGDITPVSLALSQEIGKNLNHHSGTELKENARVINEKNAENSGKCQTDQSDLPWGQDPDDSKVSGELDFPFGANVE